MESMMSCGKRCENASLYLAKQQHDHCSSEENWSKIAYVSHSAG